MIFQKLHTMKNFTSETIFLHQQMVISAISCRDFCENASYISFDNIFKDFHYRIIFNTFLLDFDN